MELTYLGQKLDTSKEHELKADNDFGFKVDIVYVTDNIFKERRDTAYNASEVHWRYSSISDVLPSNRVAFESNYHHTGFTKDISKIKSVTISYADEFYESF